MQAIIRGYNRRERGMWSATRWQTYYLMSVSMADLKKAGINKPTDLMKFPWEKEVEIGQSITEEEAAQLQKDMENWQEFLQQQRGGN